MSRDNARIFFSGLMKKHNHEDAWDDKEFENMFDLFEEDDGPEEDTPVDPNAHADGLDRGEFTKLVKRIAQL